MTPIHITGLGVVSPVGNSADVFWNAIVEGRSGVRRLENLDLTDMAITIGGQVRDLEASLADVNDKVESRRMDRATIFAVIAAGQAIAHAGLAADQLGERAAVVIGAGLSGILTLQNQTENLLRRGPRGVSPLTIPLLMPNAASANVSLAYGIKGPAYTVNSACSSSGHALIDGVEMLRRGEVDIVIAGGVEAAMTRLGISAFANMKAMTRAYNDAPEKASRPFEKDRDGFIMSEGGAILVLESERHLERRGGTSLAKIIGYGSTMDSHHLVAPDPEGRGATRAIAQALSMAELKPDLVAGALYVNAHGTSTHLNDLAETIALKKVFGQAAKQLKISSTKSVTGHMIGAACAVETAACVFAMRHSLIPPTINYDTPDPECDLDYTPNVARPASVDYCLNNSFGFGGHNVSLVLSKSS